MPRVIKSVEPYQVRVKQRSKKLLSDRESLVNLRRRKGTVEEETELDAVKPLPQEGRQHHEMVIMYPDEVVLRVDHLHDPISEDLVDGDVSLPERAIKPASEIRREREHVMKQRPELLLAETVVVSCVEIERQERWDALEVLEEELVDFFLLVGVDLFF